MNCHHLIAGRPLDAAIERIKLETRDIHLAVDVTTFILDAISPVLQTFKHKFVLLFYDTPTLQWETVSFGAWRVAMATWPGLKYVDVMWTKSGNLPEWWVKLMLNAVIATSARRFGIIFSKFYRLAPLRMLEFLKGGLARNGHTEAHRFLKADGSRDLCKLILTFL